MPLIEWTNGLSVKIPEIDEQHKKLVSIINQLHDAMIKRAGEQVLGDLLNELINYTVTHFQTEEKYMRGTSFPGYAPHKKQHDALTMQATELKAKFESGQPCVTLEVMEFLKEWLTKHIQGTDKQYTDHFLKAGVGQPTEAKS
ncbi:MAG: bacteriohemerythrin [Phycisphaerae bacterium]